MKAHIPAERSLLLVQIEAQLDEFYTRRVLESVDIGPWEIRATGCAQGPARAPKEGWKKVRVGALWGEDREDYTAWFRSKFKVPTTYNKDHGAFVELGLELCREGLVYLNGKPIHGLSKNHKAVRLVHDEHLKRANRIEIEAFTKTAQHPPSKYFGKFEKAEIRRVDRAVYDTYWDLRVALDTAKELDPGSAAFQRLLNLLLEAMATLNPLPADPIELRRLSGQVSRRFKRGLKDVPAEKGYGKIVLAGHSHIDTAWLWPLLETRRKVGRTFSSMLHLMEINPEFCFSQGQPQLYRYTKDHYPEVYEGIKKRVAEGRWDPAGPAWVEMDSNLAGGEAIIRQFLYGHLFMEEEFGVRNTVCWLPDAFGYSWNLPQLLRGCGIDSFVTTKIDWSMITDFPYTTFNWEGADGSRILAMMPPLNYNGHLEPGKLRKQWDRIKQKNVLDEMVFSFGWGDGGGGPTQEMIENGRRLSSMTGVPESRFGTITGYFDDLKERIDEDELPTWNGELYLELHRACQITQARTKRFNRKMEALLRETEWTSALDWMSGGRYPNGRLRDIWEDVLTAQFHDILPGSSVESVYKETDEMYARREKETTTLLESASKALASRLDSRGTKGEGNSAILFNSLSWDRNDPAEIPGVKLRKGERVENSDGDPLLAQPVKTEEGKTALLVDPVATPSMGYQTVRIAKGASLRTDSGELRITERLLENRFFKIRVDPKGTLSKVYDKIAKREALASGCRGNVLQMFHDHPHMHDAWDYDFNVDENCREWDHVESIHVVEEGPVRAALEVVRETEKSRLVQRIVIYRSVPRIDFVTDVDWWEKRTLLKAAFPVNVRSSFATYEIQFCAIERATHRNTPFDRARYEVAHHRWADLSEGNYGVALANDCKYGSDVLDNVIRLSLLRAPTHPDPRADEGRHRFTYSLLPHQGDWRTGEVVRRAFELNAPSRALVTQPGAVDPPPSHSWVSVNASNVVVESIKKEERGDRLVVRLYEAEGSRGPTDVRFGFPVRAVHESNMIEEEARPVRRKGDRVRLEFSPFQVRTLLVEVDR